MATEVRFIQSILWSLRQEIRNVAPSESSIVRHKRPFLIDLDIITTEQDAAKENKSCGSSSKYFYTRY